MFIFLIVWLSQVYAADPINLTVKVNPDPMVVNQPSDIIVEVLDSQWNIYKNFKGFVYFDLKGSDKTIYDIPNDSYYEFIPEDEGKKTFSKWFVIKKIWTFELNTTVAEDETYNSSDNSLTVQVVPADASVASGVDITVVIEDPIAGSTVERTTLEVQWNSKSRVPLIAYLDGERIWEDQYMTDADWYFNFYLRDIEDGNHTLLLHMLNHEWEVIGTSREVSFEYKYPQGDEFLKSFSVLPGEVILAGETITFRATTDSTVKSVKLNITHKKSGEEEEFPMDRIRNGEFEKNKIFNEVGIFNVDVVLIFDGWQELEFKNRALIEVSRKEVHITNLKAYSNATDPTKANLSREHTGDVNSYIVYYGLSEDKLSESLSTHQKEAEVSNLVAGNDYYFQVFGVDDNNEILEKWSNIARISIGTKNSGPSCTVVWISIETEKIDDEYFLIRKPVEWAKEYKIYKSEYEVDSIDKMQEIASTTVPQFRYPFDKTAEQDEYTYYAVVALCSDGSELQIDDIKKIHTGPVSDILLLLFLSFIIYLLYTIYNYSD